MIEAAKSAVRRLIYLACTLPDPLWTPHHNRKFRGRSVPQVPVYFLLSRIPEHTFMEKELNRDEVQPEAPGSAPTDTHRLELAHVLFMDLVAFSTMPME